MVRRTFADIPRLLLERHYLQGHLTTPHLHYSTANFECGAAAFSTLQFYTAARCTPRLRTAIAPGMPAALLVIKALSEIPTAGHAPQKPHPSRLDGNADLGQRRVQRRKSRTTPDSRQPSRAFRCAALTTAGIRRTNNWHSATLTQPGRAAMAATARLYPPLA